MSEIIKLDAKKCQFICKQQQLSECRRNVIYWVDLRTGIEKDIIEFSWSQRSDAIILHYFPVNVCLWYCCIAHWHEPRHEDTSCGAQWRSCRQRPHWSSANTLSVKTTGRLVLVPDSGSFALLLRDINCLPRCRLNKYRPFSLPETLTPYRRCFHFFPLLSRASLAMRRVAFL